jgi:hypothetical protein
VFEKEKVSPVDKRIVQTKTTTNENAATDLMSSEPNYYENLLRCDGPSSDELLETVTPSLTKKRRETVTPIRRTSTSLPYLATLNISENLKCSF